MPAPHFAPVVALLAGLAGAPAPVGSDLDFRFPQDFHSSHGRFCVLRKSRSDPSAGGAVGPARQEADDPALRAAVERFFSSQQEENADAYLALWSATARRPLPEVLKYVFDSGDDTFSQIEITKVMPFRDRIRVRVSATRQRIERPRVEGAPPITRNTRMQVSLTFLREDSEWKLLREGPATDDLAETLLESSSAEERARLMAAEPELLTEQLIQSIARRAGSAAQQGAWAAAQSGFERALELARYIKDRKSEAEALQNLGNAFYFQRNLPAALDAYEQRLVIERERADEAGIAAALAGIATIRYSFAEYSAAMSAYREALAIQERLGDEGLIATSLISTGNVLYLQGDYDAAIADYARSRDLSQKILNTLGVAAAQEGLGRVFLARGDYAGALEAFTGVLQEAVARGDRVAQGNATLSLGEVHFHLGNVEVARKTFDESRGHYEASKDPANVGRAWQAIALTDLVAARFSLAEEEYVKSRASCGAVVDMECVARATAGLAFAQTAQEKFVEGIASYRKAIEQFSGRRRAEQVARTQVGLSHALAGNREYKAALEAAVEARRTAIGLPNDDVLWRALVSEAGAWRHLEQRGQALAAARAAASALERLVEAARTRPANPVPRESSAVFATLAVLHAEEGDGNAAFNAIERMRAHDLRVSLAGAEREIARGMTAAERDEERRTAVDLVSLHAQLTRETGLPNPDRSRIARLEQSVGEASARRDTHEKHLFERLPELRIWRGLMQPATESDLLTLLGDGDALLEFVVSDREVLLLTVRKGETGVVFTTHVRPLTRKLLAERVARLTQPAVLRSIPEWRKASSEFMTPVVPDEVLSVLKSSKRLFVVPHEVVWRVPFEALAVADRYLGDLTTVTYVGSVTTAVRVPARETGEHPEATLLTAAAPQLSSSTRARVQQTAPDWTLRDPESAAFEAKAVARDAPPERVTSLTGPAATEPALREQLPRATIVHLALPFRISAPSPLFSPLLVSGELGTKTVDSADDGRLDAREVMNLTLQANVAVLSDGSAISMRDAAEEATLVQWAWRAAGVPSIMVPRWGNDVTAADILLGGFHQRVREGQSASDALRAAQTAVRHTESRAAPFYWAGWLLIGGR